MSTEMIQPSFATLFDQFRLRAGFKTLSEFGKALCEEGFVFEDSIFSKWRSGARVPRDRRVMLALIRVFIARKGISDIEEANRFLNIVGLRNLDSDEILELGTDDTSRINYNVFKPLIEPSTLFQHIVISPENTRFVVIEEIQNESIRDYWLFQSQCAVADYYAKSRHGQMKAEEFFKKLSEDEYVINRAIRTVAAITEDSEGREFLSTSIQLIIGSPVCSQPLRFMKFVDSSQSWHQQTGEAIGELDRFVIANWAWGARTFIVGEGFKTIQYLLSSNNIQHLYSIMSSLITALCDESNLSYARVGNTYPNDTGAATSVGFPWTYTSFEEFSMVWGKDADLYRFIV